MFFLMISKMTGLKTLYDYHALYFG